MSRSLDSLPPRFNTRSNEQTKASAQTDALTGLWNGRTLYSRFDEELANVNEQGGSLTLLLLSLSGLRAVNDAFGYKAGDRVLAEVAGRLQRVLDESGLLCRIAGDEFICMLRNHDRDLAIALGERAQTAVEKFALEARPGQYARVKLGFAVAEYLIDGETIDDLLHSAVAATRQRKSTGKLVEIVRDQTETRLAF